MNTSQKVSDIDIGVYYKCIDDKCHFSEEDIRDSYYVYFGYSKYEISHQNSTSPVYQKEGCKNYHYYEFSLKYPIKKKFWMANY